MTAATGSSAAALAAMPLTVDVDRSDVSGDLPSDADINAWIGRALAAGRDASGRAVEVAVRIVAEDEMQALNSAYRGKDAPTKVLAFPAATVDGLPPDAPQPLGDIVVCAAVVAREAVEQSKQAADHWAHLLVHGTLHLVGFDHVDAVEATAMESLERRILAAAGIGDPYAA